MSAGNSAVVELTTDVNSIVELLNDIGKHLSSVPGSTPDVVEDLEQVISALKELDAERRKAHEDLETETIKASVLRHKLTNFPHKLKAELNDLISSARQTNADELSFLQSELKRINEEADQATKTREVLELHNQVLESERASLEAKNSEMVKKLNDCMGKKAKMQIKLNETREKLRDTNTQIESSETEIHDLELTMVQEREKFTLEKNELAQQSDDLIKKCEEKEQENSKLTMELEEQQSKAVETSLAVEDKKKELKDVELAIQNMLALEEELKLKLDTGGERTKALEQLCTKTQHDTVKIQQEYAVKKADMLEKTRLFKKELESEEGVANKLLAQKKLLKRDLKHAQEGSAMQSRALRDMQENVAASKRTLLYQAEEGARLEAENKDLKFRRAQLKESHEVNVQLLKDEITDMKMALDREQRAREVVEDTYNSLQAQIKTVQSEHHTKMANLENISSDSDQQFSDMREMTNKLEKEIKELTDLNQQLSSELARGTAEFANSKERLTSEIQRLEQNIADLSDEIADRNEILSEIVPKCEKLEADFSEKQDLYESRKRDIIALKSKRSELEDNIKRIEEELEKVHIPQEKYRIDSLRCRAYTRQSLRERVLEVESIEKKVVEAKQQLAAIINENEKIEKANEKLRQDMADLKFVCERKDEVEKILGDALRLYKSELSEQWQANNEMEKDASDRDKVILGDLGTIKDASEERLETISALHGGYNEELQHFSEYLETAARGTSGQRPRSHSFSHKNKTK